MAAQFRPDTYEDAAKKAHKQFESIAEGLENRVKTIQKNLDSALDKVIDDMGSFRQSNLYAGISQDRQEKIRKDIEKDLKDKLTADLTKKISSQVEKDLKAKAEITPVQPEDIQAAMAYFKEIELFASALSMLLIKQRDDIKNQVKESLTSGWTGIAANFGLSFSLGITLFLFNVPLAMTLSCAALLSILLTVIVRYRQSPVYKSQITELEDNIKYANVLAGDARACRMVSLLSVKNNKDLNDLIAKLRISLRNLESNCIVNPIDMEAARVACESRIADVESDDFMVRLRNRQAEIESESVDENEEKHVVCR